MENPSKSEVIGRFGGNENTEWPRSTDTSRTKNISIVLPTFVHLKNVRTLIHTNVISLFTNQLYTYAYYY